MFHICFHIIISKRDVANVWKLNEIGLSGSAVSLQNHPNLIGIIVAVSFLKRYL